MLQTILSSRTTTYFLLHRHDFGMDDAPIDACILYAISCGLSNHDLADRYEILQCAGGQSEPDEEPSADADAEVEEGTGSKVRLRPWNNRTRKSMGYDGDGKPAPLIDQVHRLMHLWRAGDVVRVDEYLDARGLRRNALFHQLLQALLELSPADSEECSLLESISNHVSARPMSAEDRQADMFESWGGGHGSGEQEWHRTREAYKAAVEMLKREHDRWIQNAVYLFGFLAGIFTLPSEIKEHFPLWFAYLLALLVALITAVVALTIRASTDAWVETLKEIELSHTDDRFQPFNAFYRHYCKRIGHPQMKCELKTYLFLGSSKRRKTREYLFSVTRWYLRLALILVVAPVALSVWSLRYAGASASATAASSRASGVPPATYAGPGESTATKSVKSEFQESAPAVRGRKQLPDTSQTLTAVIIPIVAALVGGIVGSYFGYRGTLRVQRIENEERRKAAARAVLAEMFTNAERALSAESTRVLHEFLDAAWREQLPLVAQVLQWGALKRLVGAYDDGLRAYENAKDQMQQLDDQERNLQAQNQGMDKVLNLEKQLSWIEKDRKKIDTWFRDVAGEWISAMQALRDSALDRAERSVFDDELRSLEGRLKSAKTLGEAG